MWRLCAKLGDILNILYSNDSYICVFRRETIPVWLHRLWSQILQIRPAKETPAQTHRSDAGLLAPHPVHFFSFNATYCSPFPSISSVLYYTMSIAHYISTWQANAYWIVIRTIFFSFKLSIFLFSHSFRSKTISVSDMSEKVLAFRPPQDSHADSYR